MKKIILIVLVILGIFIFRNNAEQVIIPSSAIRFRIIANSDSNIDQDTKILIRNSIQKQLTADLNNSSNIEEARNTIKSNLSNYENIVKTTLSENNIDSAFTINYGKNHFPEKEYKGVKYEEGDYESLLVTLGNGLGHNWWCVLFPPLCLLEAEEDQQIEEVEYKFFIKEIIDKYLK